METTVIVVIVLFTLIIVAIFVFLRQRGKMEKEIEFKQDARNVLSAPPGLGANIMGAESRLGSLVPDDRADHGVNIQDVEAQDDILMSAAPPHEIPSPKAYPPA